ncbi:serine/threonine-protein kinase [Oryzihumus leptocrescens]|uniref:non-specific serine/threonine protein kinase n=1 Tax=Oryzihumus leptocrescens TaxID=297536 RepID=A0A542ZGM7_9MICO|nr:serine/threonine-protein kinase [Oryzihumus leptocrescens]TQL59474.1 serine/threonine protein kinase [Oryzihumus leptocrescens]
MEGQRIAGRYHVVRAIGRGGMGTVWLCRDEVLGREVAVKQIGALPGESVVEKKRAMREARAAAALNHHNAVAVYDVVDHDDRPWLVMEFVDGHTLAEEISREGRLSPQRAADIGSQLASALSRAHERRIVHRDIKPANVLIDRWGRPKISDFGIARGHGDDQLTQTGFVTGTPGYLSPELARGGDPDAASDVWALAATIYAAVEGRGPYESRPNPIAVLQTIATQRPRETEHAGPLEPALAAMMHEDPDQRWDMATASKQLARIARDGQAAVTPAPTRVQPAVPVSDVGEPTRPWKAPASGGAAGAAAAGAAAAGSAAANAAPATAQGTAPAASSGAAAAGADTARAGSSATPAAPTARQDAVPTARQAAAPASSAADGSGVSDDSDVIDTRRRGKALPVLALVLVLLLLVGGYALSHRSTSSGTGTAAPPKPSSSPKASTPSASATTSDSPSPSPSSTTPTSSPTTSAPAPATDASLSQFVRSYFANVTGNRDVTWPELTSGMQAAAGGRSGYDQFWRTISAVRVGGVQADASGRTATARLTYVRQDGSTSSERHVFTFVRQGDQWLIASEHMG